jgi:osmoprotectant transport system ATP-binding protein
MSSRATACFRTARWRRISRPCRSFSAGIQPADRQSRRGTARLFNLDPAIFADKYPHQLSGGEQQRVGVARALAAEPEVLIMDEPFGALDPVIRGKAQDDLLAIQKQFGTTVILVTHDMDEAFHLGNRIAVMSEGRLLQYSTPEKILTEPADPFVQQLTGTSDRALKRCRCCR